jgi:hypothetical protein
LNVDFRFRIRAQTPDIVAVRMRTHSNLVNPGDPPFDLLLQLATVMARRGADHDSMGVVRAVCREMRQNKKPLPVFWDRFAQDAVRELGVLYTPTVTVVKQLFSN